MIQYDFLSTSALPPETLHEGHQVGKLSQQSLDRRDVLEKALLQGCNGLKGGAGSHCLPLAAGDVKGSQA